MKLKDFLNKKELDNSPKFSKYQELLLQSIRSEDISTIKDLLNKKINVNFRDERGHTPLLTACFKNNFKIINLLLENGADVNYSDRNGNSPLMMACYHSNINLIKLLLNKQANINKQNIKGITALMIACNNQNWLVARLLLQQENINVNLLCDHQNALMIACAFFGGDKELASLLPLFIKRGINLNQQDSDGETALMHAIKTNKIHVVSVLLKNGADIDLKNNKGFSAFDIAFEHNVDKKITQMLLAYHNKIK